MYFLDTVDTVKPYLGFQQFGTLHLCWIVAFILFVIIGTILYRRLDDNGRSITKKALAIIIIFDEIFKQTMLLYGGNWTNEYLPLHLCSINILLIAIHAFKPNKLLDNFLYLVAIPGAMLAIFCPTWSSLPLWNFMHIHSFTIHILLAGYPLILTISGDIVPDIKYIPKCLLFLAVLAIPISITNIMLGTNYMFLSYAPSGTPLLWFAENTPSHLIGIAVLLPIVIAIMEMPIIIKNKLSNKS